MSRTTYAKEEVFDGLEVRLYGLKNTNTEGIERLLSTGDPVDTRLFERLLPGRYRVEVHGRGTSDTIAVHPIFKGVEYVELNEEGVTSWTNKLDVVKARIQGRIYAADKKVRPPNSLEDEVFQARPKYRGKAVSNIQLIEAEEDACLIEAARVVTIESTDENGFFTALLPPARYGIRIESLEDYWGSHVLLTDVSPVPLSFPLPPPVTSAANRTIPTRPIRCP